jgi:hypothetical protein
MNNKKKLITKHRVLIFLLTFVFSSVFFPLEKVLAISSDFPKLANYYLSWDMDDAKAIELSKWDLVVLDMEIQLRRPELIRKMRSLNPQIILLAYITPQEIVKDASTSYSVMRKNLASGIYDDWYLKDSKFIKKYFTVKYIIFISIGVMLVLSNFMVLFLKLC